MHKARYIFINSFLAQILVVTILLGLYLHSIYKTLPDLQNPEYFQPYQSSVYLDKDGNELYRFYTDEDRSLITLEEIPKHVQEAFIAIEDKRFYTRSCIDIRALSRAVYANITSYKSQGASTITQQLVRTMVLDRTKSFERKIREIMLACQVEQQYSKEEILTLYLNWISFGHGIAGIKQASNRLFDTPVNELNIAQASVLASLPQRPSYFSPFGPNLYTHEVEKAHEDTDLEISLISNDVQIGLLGSSQNINGKEAYYAGRTDIVLDAMQEQGYITEADNTQALFELAKLDFNSLALSIKAPHFVVKLQEELKNITNELSSKQQQQGFTVQTTIDGSLQALAETTIKNYQEKMVGTFKAQNAAMLAIDTKSNEIVAYVGNTNFFDDEHGGQIDMVRTPRQLGSSFKPFIYASLLEQGYTPDDYIYDSPYNSVYVPFRSGYYGRMTLTTALARSRNVPAVRAFYLAGGEDHMLDFASNAGVTTPKWNRDVARQQNYDYKYSWPMALGSIEASLLEMLEGYSTIANEGIHRPISGVKSIQSHDKSILFRPQHQPTRVMSAESANGITNMLSNEQAREVLWYNSMHLPFGNAAIKTGTSTICLERSLTGACKIHRANNTWAFGYIDDLLVGVWIGNVDNAGMEADVSSFEVAMPIWKDFVMNVYESNHPILSHE